MFHRLLNIILLSQLILWIILLSGCVTNVEQGTFISPVSMGGPTQNEAIPIGPVEFYPQDMAQSFILSGGALQSQDFLYFVQPNSNPVVTLGPGGIAWGGVFADVNYPNELQHSNQDTIALSPNDIEIVGPVSASSKSWRFGVGQDFSRLARYYWGPIGGFLSFISVSKGNSDYGKLTKEIKAKENVDGILNLTVDSRCFYILPSFSPLSFNTVETRVYGIGYRLKYNR